MGYSLYPHQEEAVRKMKNGCVLCGDVGSGKSRTAVAYYVMKEGGIINRGVYMDIPGTPIDIYVITTARKRDDLDWEKELNNFKFSTDPESNYYDNKCVVDSWNNIQKYKNVKGAFFIFDEQRVVGKGKWVDAFLKISKCNEWVLLSATPGDTPIDYIPLLIANGFYRTRTQFNAEHVIYDSWSKFPRVKCYINESEIWRQIQTFVVMMEDNRTTKTHHIDILCGYEKLAYKWLWKHRCDPMTGKPFKNITGLFYAIRKLVNSDVSRGEEVVKIVKEKNKCIIFYNFDYELEILKSLNYGKGVKKAEYNGHKHEKIPEGKKWVYFVQYNAGAEGWNCVETDTIIFYSQNYSYKIMHQAAGRTNRMNTTYKDLYYYHLKSRSPIDLAISRAIAEKKDFNEKTLVKEKTNGKKN